MQYPNWFKKLFKLDVDIISEAVMLGNDTPSLERLQTFVRDSVWKYITDTIDFRIKSARDDLEDQHLDIETIRVYQGRIEELRFIRSLPQFVIENFEQLRAEIQAKSEAEKKEEPKKETLSWQKKE